MANKRRVSLAVLESLLFLLAVWFEPTCIVRGTLRGEAFYDGKPTSWWSEEIEHWDAGCVGGENGPKVIRVRDRTYFDRLKSGDWKLWKTAPPTYVVDYSPILRGDPGSEPLLRELATDQSALVRYWAGFGLRRLPQGEPKAEP
jgi:hypothetical protein